MHKKRNRKHQTRGRYIYRPGSPTGPTLADDHCTKMIPSIGDRCAVPPLDVKCGPRCGLCAATFMALNVLDARIRTLDFTHGTDHI